MIKSSHKSMNQKLHNIETRVGEQKLQELQTELIRVLEIVLDTYEYSPEDKDALQTALYKGSLYMVANFIHNIDEHSAEEHVSRMLTDLENDSVGTIQLILGNMRTSKSTDAAIDVKRLSELIMKGNYEQY